MDEMKRLEDMCRAVLPPGPQRLARARARLLTAIAEDSRRASRRAPGRRWIAMPPGSGRRWPGWAAPLAAAAAVVAVIAGTLTLSGAIHSPPAASGAGRGHRAAAYVANAGSGTVTPIRTATSTALAPVKTGGPSSPSRSPRTGAPPTSPASAGGR